MFEEISVKNFSENVFDLIGKKWMLITAGNLESFNTMTASWGGMGNLWNVPVAFIFVRPQRHTYNFIERESHFTLSFFEKKYHHILSYCGSHTGKEVDKAKETGLKSLETKLGNIVYEQARLVVECQKIYFDDIKPELFVDRLIQRNYPNKDYHRMYIGKIINILSKEK